MATTEDIARLILEADTKGFAEAQTQIASTRTALDTLAASYTSGAIGIEKYYREGAKLQARLDQLEGGYRRADEALKKHGSTQKAIAAITSETTNKMAGLGQSLLQGGRALQDFQAAGFMGIANNLEGLAASIGLGPGIAGAVTALGAAFLAFKPQIMEFLSSFDEVKLKSFVSELDAVKLKIKEIEDNPLKTTADFKAWDEAKEKLDQLTKAQAAFKAAGEGKTVFEVEAGKQFKDVFEQEGQRGKAVRDAMVKAEADRMGANSPEIKKAMEQEKQLLKDIEFLKSMTASSVEEQGMINSQIGAKAEAAQAAAANGAARQAEIQDRARNAISGMLEGAFAGNNAQAREDLTKRLRGVGAEDLAKAAELSNPTEMQRQAEDEAAQEAAIERQKEANKQRAANKKKADAAEKLALDQAAGIDADNKKAFDAWKRSQDKKAGVEKRAKTKEDTEADRVVEKNTAEAAQGIGARAKGMTGLEAGAENILAQALASGQAKLDANGKLSEQGFSQFADVIGQVIKQQQPGMNPLQAAGLANRIAANAEQDVSGQLAAQLGDGINLQQATLNVLGQTQAALAQMGNKQQALWAQLNRLQQNGQQVRRQLEQPNFWAGNPVGE